MNYSRGVSEQISGYLKPFPAVEDCSVVLSFLYPSHMMNQSSVFPSINHSSHPPSFEYPFENRDLEPRPVGPLGFVGTKIDTKQPEYTEILHFLRTINSDADTTNQELVEPVPVPQQQQDPIDTLYYILHSAKARASETNRSLEDSSDEQIESKQSRLNLKRKHAYSNEESIPRFSPYQEDLWRVQFKKLVEFKLKNGHCCVPHYYKEDLVLARWVKRQRFQYKKLQENDPTSTMTSRRIDELESIGFVWHYYQASWLEKLDELKAFKEMTGHCMVPAEYPENVQLSTWVKSQRRQYREYAKGQPSNMNTQRYQALKSLGFVFDVRKDE